MVCCMAAFKKNISAADRGARGGYLAGGMEHTATED